MARMVRLRQHDRIEVRSLSRWKVQPFPELGDLWVALLLVDADIFLIVRHPDAVALFY